MFGYNNCSMSPMSPMEKEFRQKQMNIKMIHEMEEYKACITKICLDYINMIDSKIIEQDLKIKTTVDAMRDSIVETTTKLLNDVLASGEISIDVVYDPVSESLIIGGKV